jgi:methylphosphotriester-DNA--protein-cysteine methyltransferase
MTFVHFQVASVLNEFAAQYAREFDAAHCWPPAIRASVLLRSNADRTWHVEDLARAVYVSPATLGRSFTRIFGVTALQYQARLRLRGAVERIRSDESSIEGILIDRGYRSPKDAYRLFKRLTGMTLSDVRRMSEIEYAALMNGPLALPTLDGRNRSSRPQVTAQV